MTHFEEFWDTDNINPLSFPSTGIELREWSRAAYNAGMTRAIEICKDTPYSGDGNHDDSVLIYEKEVIAAIRAEMKPDWTAEQIMAREG